MKKKRKIKVRAYDLAGTVGVAPTDVKQLMVNSTPAVNALKQGIPASPTSSGIDFGGAISAVPNVISGISNLAGLVTGESTATTKGQVVGQSLASIGSGMATGMQAGMAVGGPVGAIVGAGIGTIMGGIGKKGRYASMTSFTDYDEGTFSTGLRALGGANRRRRRERARIKANAYDNRDAVRGSDALQTDYYEDYANMGTDTFAVGGQTSSLAYVDDGELMRTPDGQISKVPERGKPTDSNLVNIPDGTRILSNTLKVPGTKYTFAQMADKMIKRRKSRGNDMYAQNAAKLNQMNDEQMYNQLFELQEQVKAKKGIKPKTKQLIPAAKNGLNPYAYDTKFNDYDNFYDIGYKKFVNSLKAGDSASENWLKRINSGEFGNIGGNTFSMNDITRLALDRKKGPVHNAIYAASRNYMNDYMNKHMPDLTMATPSWRNTSLNDTPLPGGQPDMQRIYAIGQRVHNEDQKKLRRQQRRANILNGLSDNLGDIAGSLSALPGIISDLGTKPEKFDAVYNPYANSVRNVFANRRYDIDAAMEEARRNRAVSNYNANQFNSNTGANLAYRLQSARNYDDNVAKLRDAKNNAENQYKADYANAMNDLGRQWVASTNLAVDQNARSRAAARNIQRQGYAEIGKLGQQWAKNYNQRMRDREMLPLYDRFLSAGFTDEDLELLRKNLRSYRTRKG